MKGFDFMKRSSLSFYFCIICFVGHSQNLVPNPSFESLTTCSLTGGSVSIGYVSDWFSPCIHFLAAGDSPDAFNACATGFYSVPTNGFGRQNAHTGIGYAGLICLGPDNREYIEAKLSAPLDSGKTYHVEFYVNSPDSIKYCIDGLGAYISTDSLLSNNSYQLQYSSQINNPMGNVIADTANWILVSGQLIANGGEQFITIGNFNNDTNTVIDTMSYGYPGSYYYFDDIDVHCMNCSVSGPVISDYPEISLVSNLSNGEFLLNGNFPSATKFEVYNALGQLIFIEDIEEGNRSVPFDLQAAEGVYSYRVVSNGSVLNSGKLVVQK